MHHDAVHLRNRYPENRCWVRGRDKPRVRIPVGRIRVYRHRNLCKHLHPRFRLQWWSALLIRQTNVAPLGAWIKRNGDIMNKLQEKRKESGLSQSQLSDKSGVKLNTIQKLETGTNGISGAKVSTIYALAKALGCTMESLIAEEWDGGSRKRPHLQTMWQDLPWRAQGVVLPRVQEREKKTASGH